MTVYLLVKGKPERGLRAVETRGSYKQLALVGREKKKKVWRQRGGSLKYDFSAGHAESGAGRARPLRTRSAPVPQPRNSRSAPAGAAGGPASSGGQGSGGGPLRFMLRDLAGLFTKP